MGGKIYFRITKDLENRIKKVKLILFFLDYDGTLTPIRRKPPLAKIPKNTRELLKNLSKKKWAKVIIVTGRTLRNIKNLIKLGSISYVGNHGFELEDRNLKYYNRKTENSKRAIKDIYNKLKKSLKIKGVILENKFYTLSVHYRLVQKRLVEILKNIVYNIAIPYRKKDILLITEGKKVIEIRPNLKWNKGSMVNWILKKIKRKDTLSIYIGDDKTDEDAFKTLKGVGLTFLVSKKKVPTKAKYRIESPKEVTKLLNNIIKLRNV